MHKQIFVNLACNDLPKSKAFFEKLGLAFNPQFTNDMGACLMIGENIFAMLLTRDFFGTFTSKTICDSARQVEVLTALSCESRAEVDDLVAKALAAGGTAPRAVQDLGFMYSHSFDDLDGHTWELVYMDPNAKPPH